MKQYTLPRTAFSLIFGVMFTAVFLLSASTKASVSPFPTYKCIEPNIAFWKKVFGEYPSDIGLIHDSDNLAVIYEVVKVESTDNRSSRRSNRQKIKKIKRKYQEILNNLAVNKKPLTAEEKRVAALFGEMGSPKVWKAAAENIRFQLCLSDRFKSGIIRSGQYLTEIKSIFRQNGLPVDLAYLPHVESSYNYEAYSKFGAAGIWQFIRSTGRRFLTVNYTLDERRDPIAATHAAAKYLKENYQILNNWPLAITAYNHGANSMLKAQNKLGDYETILNEYNNRRFGFASRNFYSEFLAAREIAKNYRSYFNNISMDTTVRTKQIQLQGYLPIDSLARHFNLDYDTIRTLNPALRKPVYLGQKYIPKGYSVRLPFHLENFEQLSASIPVDFYKTEQKRSRFYRVERGDTAGKIARMHRVSIKDLIDINNLNRRATIYIGQNLRIPAPGEKIALARASVKEKAEPPVTLLTKSKLAPIAPVKEPEAATPHVAAVPPPSEPRLAQLETTTVKSPTSPLVEPPEQPILLAAGPSGTQESTENSQPEPPEPTAKATSMAALKQPPSPAPQVAESQRANVPPEIRAYQPPFKIAGEELPAVEPPVSSIAEVNPEVVFGNFKIERVVEKKGQKIGYVQIEDTETLGHYADWLEIPTQRIRDLNGFAYGKQIRTHQTIKIPLGKVGKELFEERRYEHHKEVEEDFFSAYKVVGVQAYSIKRGDNIWTLCRDKLELPFWLIRKYNPVLNFDSLRPKQRLTIPVTEPITNPVALL